MPHDYDRNFDRNKNIAIMRASGATLKSVGLKYGLSGDRVRSIYHKMVSRGLRSNTSQDVIVGIYSPHLLSDADKVRVVNRISEMDVNTGKY